MRFNCNIYGYSQPDEEEEIKVLSSKAAELRKKAEKLIYKHLFTENNIKAFMALYRAFFPNATVLPKMHILEDHVISWVRKYNTGFGLLGEQGIESLHHLFNELHKTYANIRKEDDQLQYVLKEHHRRCHPANVVKIPPIKHRKYEE